MRDSGAEERGWGVLLKEITEFEGKKEEKGRVSWSCESGTYLSCCFVPRLCKTLGFLLCLSESMRARSLRSRSVIKGGKQAWHLKGEEK